VIPLALDLDFATLLLACPLLLDRPPATSYSSSSWFRERPKVSFPSLRTRVTRPRRLRTRRRVSALLRQRKPRSSNERPFTRYATIHSSAQCYAYGLVYLVYERKNQRLCGETNGQRGISRQIDDHEGNRRQTVRTNFYICIYSAQFASAESLPHPNPLLPSRRQSHN
jgi:hypothetical protein